MRNRIMAMIMIIFVTVGCLPGELQARPLILEGKGTEEEPYIIRSVDM